MRRDPNLRIGYLPQSFKPEEAITIGESVSRASGSVEALEGELADLSAGLAAQPADLTLQERYDELLRRIQQAQTGRSAAILASTIATSSSDLRTR